MQEKKALAIKKFTNSKNDLQRKIAKLHTYIHALCTQYSILNTP
jgi:hypothetical protein